MTCCDCQNDTTHTGTKLIYLPPYSPDLNPIEQAFSSIKAWLHCHEAQAMNAAVRPWSIHQAIDSISVNDAEGWIQNCGYTQDYPKEELQKQYSQD